MGQGIPICNLDEQGIPICNLDEQGIPICYLGVKFHMLTGNSWYFFINQKSSHILRVCFLSVCCSSILYFITSAIRLDLSRLSFHDPCSLGIFICVMHNVYCSVTPYYKYMYFWLCQNKLSVFRCSLKYDFTC